MDNQERKIKNQKVLIIIETLLILALLGAALYVINFDNKKISELENNNKEITAQVAEKDADLLEKDTKITTLQKSIDDINNELGSYKKENDAIKAEKSKLLSQITSLNKQLTSKNSSIDKLNSDISLKTAAIEALNETIKAKDETIASKTKTEKEMFDEITSLTNTKKTIDKDLETLTSQVKDLSDQIKELTKQIEELQKLLKELSDKDSICTVFFVYNDEIKKSVSVVKGASVPAISIPAVPTAANKLLYWEDTSNIQGDTVIFTKEVNVTVAGIKKIGEELVAEPSNSSLTYEYQWYRDGAKISGATSAAYTLTDDDFDAKIKVKINVKDDTAHYIYSDETAKVVLDDNKQLAKDFNTSLALSTATDIVGVQKELKDGGYTGNFIPTGAGLHYYWNTEDHKVYLVNDSVSGTLTKIYPFETVNLTASKLYRMDYSYHRVSSSLTNVVATATDIPGIVKDGDTLTGTFMVNSTFQSYKVTGLSSQKEYEEGTDYTLTKNGTLGTLSIPNVTEDLLVYADGCIAKGTLITLADGSKKKVEDLKLSDSILSYNQLTGTLSSCKVLSVMESYSKLSPVITLGLANGSEVKIVDYESVFNVDSLVYEQVSISSYKEAVGKTIMVNNDGAIGSSKIVSSTLDFAEVTYYTMFTENFSYIGNNIVMSTAVDSYNLITPIGNDYKIDATRYNKLVSLYGQYSYDEFSDYISLDLFNSQRIKDYKFLVGMGLCEKQDIVNYLAQLNYYIDSNAAKE